MLAVSEAQRRAMFAASAGKPISGVSQKVGNEFMVDDAPEQGAGIIFVASDGAVLLLCRSAQEANYAGHWSIPGGKGEPGETPWEIASREAGEEIGTATGHAWVGEPTVVDKVATPTGMVFTTFVQPVGYRFVPEINAEHCGYVWARVGSFPMPMHPQVESVLAALFPEGASDATWNESDHPRDNEGKFGSGGRASNHEGTKIVNGNRMTSSGQPLPSHIADLKIPPAWTDVTFNPDPAGELLATGKDAKGRLQAVYSSEFSAKQAAVKFARINDLNNKFNYIAKQNEEARKSDNPKKAAAADCAKLIMTTGIRPGSAGDTGADKKAYGATTLEGRHVAVDGDKVSLRFVGKKGVSLDIPVTDPATAKMLRDRKTSAGNDGQLFPINEKTLLEHVHSLDGGGFKTKDFRTLLGTRTAMSVVSAKSPPKDGREYRKKVMEVARTVAAALGNTPTVALQSYINPAVFAEWRMAA